MAVYNTGGGTECELESKQTSDDHLGVEFDPWLLFRLSSNEFCSLDHLEHPEEFTAKLLFCLFTEEQIF